MEGQEEYALRRSELLSKVNELDGEERQLIASYMRKGTIILAFMEYTTDIIAAKFGTSGGSGILSDGNYFWRGDAADYVEKYGISPGDEFLESVLDKEGTPPTLTKEEVLEIDDYFVFMRDSQ
ncbi:MULTISPECIES: hypothetical protein [Streptomyces]|uniref:Uncharacterized protein n=1 Tax=Streptomyces lichenis TaxID=2306967 RepID=A0ABT0I5E4_9ACTN|nr:hypothetical protein [Streptomyces lichenis]MCK8676528.1 hypothetical protein [Streptomyces lichenis]